MGGAISEQVALGCKRHPGSQPAMDSLSSNLPWVLLQFLIELLALMMDCDLELLAEINSFLSKLFLLRLFHHSNRKQTKTKTTESN